MADDADRAQDDDEKLTAATVAALELREVPEFWRRLAMEGELQSAMACRFLAYTWVRTSEMRMMTWDEVSGDQWTIPAQRMKRRRFRWCGASKWRVEMTATTTFSIFAHIPHAIAVGVFLHLLASGSGFGGASGSESKKMTHALASRCSRVLRFIAAIWRSTSIAVLSFVGSLITRRLSR